MSIWIWAILAWLAVGIVVASNTDREQDGFVFTVILWPIQLAAKYFGNSK